MSEFDYKPNSHKSKAEQPAVEKKQIEKVVRGTVKTKPKSGLSKFAGDVGANLTRYAWEDVLLPSLKKAVTDIVKDGIDMIMYGETRGRRSSSGASSYVSYRDYSRRDDDRRDRGVSRTRTGYAPDDITLESRGEAEEVLSRMDELIETYGVVSVADLYDLIGKTCQYTDNKYGWTNIRNAEPIRVRDGWLLKLPKALPIN